MAFKLANMARMTTATFGTGTITLVAAVAFLANELPMNTPAIHKSRTCRSCWQAKANAQ